LWPSDGALVARVLEGDLEAFGVILARYQGRVYSIAANFAANSDDASDLAQDIFLKVYRSLGGFRGQAAFSTWLYRIAVNACVDYTRRRRQATFVPLDDELALSEYDHGPGPEDAAQRRQLRAELARAIGGLSTKLRVALILHDVEGLTHEEISRIVGCSVGTTKSRLFRAREEMRRRLAPPSEETKK
jgi:RNA polymerase sigma-70 factor (ECF subfamily)